MLFKIANIKTNEIINQFVIYGMFASMVLGAFKGAYWAIAKAKKLAESIKDFDEKVSETNAQKNEKVIEEAIDNEADFEKLSKINSDAFRQENIDLRKQILLEETQKVEANSEVKIREQLENGETPSRRFEEAITDMIESLKNVREEIKAGSLDNATDKLSKTSERIEKTLTEDRVAMNEAETELLSKSSKATSESADAVDSLKSAQDEYEELNESLEIESENIIDPVVEL